MFTIYVYIYIYKNNIYRKIIGPLYDDSNQINNFEKYSSTL